MKNEIGLKKDYYCNNFVCVCISLHSQNSTFISFDLESQISVKSVFNFKSCENFRTQKRYRPINEFLFFYLRVNGNTYLIFLPTSQGWSEFNKNTSITMTATCFSAIFHLTCIFSLKLKSTWTHHCCINTPSDCRELLNSGFLVFVGPLLLNYMLELS